VIKADLTALPAALERFKGFYARYPNYILTNPMHNLVGDGSYRGRGIDFRRVGIAPVTTPAAWLTARQWTNFQLMWYPGPT
jgi:hypothetical protein